MAMEAIKWIHRPGDALLGAVDYDGLRGRAETVKLSRDPNCPTCDGALSPLSSSDPAANAQHHLIERRLRVLSHPEHQSAPPFEDRHTISDSCVRHSKWPGKA